MCGCHALGEEGGAEAGSGDDGSPCPAQPTQVLLRAAQKAGKGGGEKGISGGDDLGLGRGYHTLTPDLHHCRDGPGPC